MGDPNPLRLLAVAGTMRSSPTRLDMLLGDTPLVLSGGDLRTIWERGYLRGQPRSCGKPIQRCELWSEVMTKAFGSTGEPDPAPHQVAEWQRIALWQGHIRPIARSVATDPDLADDSRLRDCCQTVLQPYRTKYSTTMFLDLPTAFCDAVRKTSQMPLADGPEAPK